MFNFNRTRRPGIRSKPLSASSPTFPAMNKGDDANLRASTTVLLAEDNEDDAVLIMGAFQEAHVPYQLQQVEDGEDAIRYLQGEGTYGDRARHPLPFLLLLDLKMPVKSGFEVLDWIRSQPHFDRLLVVVLSGSALPGDVGRANQLGTNSYLVKSSDYKQLVLLLKSFRPQPPGG